MRRPLPAIAAIVVLLFLLDQLYRLLHPEVNLTRAALVGASGGLALVALRRAGLRWLDPASGALAIWLSATLSVLAIEAGWLVSRSPLSAVVHVAILTAAFMILEAARHRLGPLGEQLR